MEEVLGLQHRDIVLVPFPFTDQTGNKRRPALIISSDEFNRESQDIIALAITSYSNGEKYEVAITPEDWKNGNYSESHIKTWAVCTIDKELIIKKIGRLSVQKYNKAIGKLNEIIK